jgi:hypothetical protein
MYGSTGKMVAVSGRRDALVEIGERFITSPVGGAGLPPR